MRKIMLSVVACCALIAIVPASALAHGNHHKRHHSRVHHRTFGHDWSQSGSTSTTTSTSSDQNAGTVQSFTGGVLTIALNSGQMVSGDVTGDTEIECQAAADMSSSMSSHDDGDHGGGGNGGDQSGGGNGGDQSGGGNGGDQGDDQGQGDDNGENANCSSADLTPGTVVHEASLRLSGAGATWDKVELVTAAAANNNNDNDNDGD
jgi:hypothetical protein